MTKNVIVVCADEMRADVLNHLGCTAASTPNLDELAKDGISFKNAFCQNPVCTPSRCSFLSGLYPHVNGHRTMTHMIQPHESIILNELKDNNYYVWINGRNDFLPAQYKGFYEKYCDEFVFNMPKEQPDKEIKRGEAGNKFYYAHMSGVNYNTEYKDTDRLDCDSVLEFLDRTPKDKPFFMFWGLNNPHPTYMALQKYVDKIDESKIEIKDRFNDISNLPKMMQAIIKNQGLEDATNDDLIYIKKIYLAMCAYVDDLVGEMVKKLKQTGQYDNTAIFFISDHGDFTGDYGMVEKAQNLFFDCLVNVPLIYKPIKGESFKSGINDNLVELIDLYPTILDITATQMTHNYNGKNLKGAILGQQDFKKAVFCEGGRLNNETQCIETGPLNKGINVKSEYYPRQLAQSMSDGTHTKATMCRTKNFKYIKRLYENDEFYDLTKDKEERINLIENSEYKNEIAMHKEYLLEWYQETCDIVPLKKDSRFSCLHLKNILEKRGQGAMYDLFVQPQLDAGKDLLEIIKGFDGKINLQ